LKGARVNAKEPGGGLGSRPVNQTGGQEWINQEGLESTSTTNMIEGKQLKNRERALFKGGTARNRGGVRGRWAKKRKPRRRQQTG